MPRPERILLLDDDVHFGAVVARRLVRSGLEVQTLQTGAAALAWLACNTVDLVVLDFRLGDMTARELIDTLQQRGISPEFIVITAFGDERIAVDMMKRGARDYLMKDAAIFELLPVVVAQALARIQQERRLAEMESSLHLLELAVSNAHDGIAVLSAEEVPQLLYANPAFRESTAPAIGEHVSFETLHDDDAGEVLRRLQRGEVSQRRLRREPPGQPPRIVDSSLTPVHTEAGTLEQLAEDIQALADKLLNKPALIEVARRTASCWRSASSAPRPWRPSGSSPGGWPTTSTTS